MPVPAPATLYLMKSMVLTAGPKGAQGELVTPTGAALIRALCGLVDIHQFPPYNGCTDIQSVVDLKKEGSMKLTSRQGTLPPNFMLLNVGHGSGKKDFPNHPNILRLMLGEFVGQGLRQVGCDQGSNVGAPQSLVERSSSSIQTNSVVNNSKIDTISLVDNENSVVPSSSILYEKKLLLETNIDDMTAEMLSSVCNLLLESGANDVWQESIVMKKGRLAAKLCVLCSFSDKDKFAELIFLHTTAIGLRIIEVERQALPRRIVNLSTDFGSVTAKVCISLRLRSNFTFTFIYS
jgi:uncharacterized protein (DUF111 family)